MTIPSLLPVETTPGAWGVEEISEGHPTRVLCECGHDTPEEALACARPRSLDRLAQVAHSSYVSGYPTSRAWDHLDECGRGRWRETIADVLRALGAW